MKKWAKKGQKSRFFSGLTMIEVVITMAILVFVLLGFLKLFIYCSSLAEMSRNLTAAMTDSQVVLEQMRYYNFDKLSTDYASGGIVGDTFTLSRLDGLGKIYITGANPEVLDIEIVVSYRSAGNHTVGEDDNFNGTLEAAEDDNGNNKLDSPASLLSIISKR